MEPSKQKSVTYSDSYVPRPVLIFASLILLLVVINAITGGLGANKPDNLALAVGDGLMSVFHDDKGLKQMNFLFTKDGKNVDGTVELRNYGIGLGGIIFGSGAARAGGKLYFQNYQHRSGVVINGGPLDIEVSNADSEKEKAGRFRIQGSVMVKGNEQPVYVQLEFISLKDTYEVKHLTGDISVNGKNTTLHQ